MAGPYKSPLGAFGGMLGFGAAFPVLLLALGEDMSEVSILLSLVPAVCLWFAGRRIGGRLDGSTESRDER